MKIKCITILLVAILFIDLAVSAQNQGNQWCFGYDAALDFNSGSPIPIYTSELYTDEGCASIADKTTGNLLFYTDGNVVYDATNTVMPNGNGLGAGNDGSCTQAAVIVPKPGSNNIYYIFTSTSQVGFYSGTDSGFNVNVVDMSLHGGLGDVTIKDSLLLTPTTEKCATTLACNGIDYWVVAHQWNSDAFYAYLITSNGISTPVISHSGIVYQDVDSGVNGEAAGYMRISTDGKKLALACSIDLNAVQIFDFDNSTGVISNPITDMDYPDHSGEDGPYGVCFSPDNSKLYITYETYSWYDGIILLSNGSTIYQYNLLASDIIGSRSAVGYDDFTLGAVQQAPDGKLYVARWGESYIGSITNPDSLNCYYKDSSIDINLDGDAFVHLSFYGLPDIIPNYPLSTNSTSAQPQSQIICSGQSVILGATGGITYTWSPQSALSSSTGDTVVANPTSTTTYTVTMTTITGCNSVDTITVFVIPSPNKPTFSQHGDTLISSSEYDNQWYRNDTLLTNDTSQYHIINILGEYWVNVLNEANGCSTSSNSIFVTDESTNFNCISIYPNPTFGKVFVNLCSPPSTVKYWNLKVIDELGRTVYLIPSLNNYNEIDLSNLPAAMYFISVTTNTERTVSPVVKVTN